MLVMRMKEKITPKIKCLNVKTNSFNVYHEKYVETSEESLHFDISAYTLGLRDKQVPISLFVTVMASSDVFNIR